MCSVIIVNNNHSIRFFHLQPSKFQTSLDIVLTFAHLEMGQTFCPVTLLSWLLLPGPPFPSRSLYIVGAPRTPCFSILSHHPRPLISFHTFATTIFFSFDRISCYPSSPQTHCVVLRVTLNSNPPVSASLTLGLQVHFLIGFMWCQGPNPDCEHSSQAVN